MHYSLRNLASSKTPAAGRLALAFACVLAVCAATASFASDADVAQNDGSTLRFGADRVIFTPTSAAYSQARLIVTGPGRLVFQQAFAADEPIVWSAWDAAGRPAADGRYRWELKLTDEDAGEGTRRAAERAAGSFEVTDGSPRMVAEPAAGEALIGGSTEAVENHFPNDLGTSEELCVGCSVGFEPGSELGNEAVTVIDSGLSPGIVLATSESIADLEDGGWEIGLDGPGGELYFSDMSSFGSSEVRPLAIADGSPDETLFLSSTGAVGLGTASPVANLHLANGSDVLFDGGNAVWHVTADDDMTFRLQDDGSGTDHGAVLTLEDESASTPSGVGVGIFADNPFATLHIGSPDDGSATLLIEERSPTVARRQMFRIQNNGSPELALVDTDLGVAWRVGTRGNSFEVNRGPGSAQLLVRNNGNLEIKGTLSQGSSRAIKENFRGLDSRDVLERVNELPLLEWSYREREDDERHFGPMAEDFHAVFGLGLSREHLAPGDAAGVALAAIQGLQGVVDEGHQERDREVEALRSELDELRALVRELQR